MNSLHTHETGIVISMVQPALHYSPALDIDVMNQQRLIGLLPSPIQVTLNEFNLTLIEYLLYSKS